MARATIALFVVLSCLYVCMHGFIAGTYVTFLQAHGLDLLQVNLVNTAFFATLFVCEIPTGAFADIFGRKASFVISCIVQTGSLVMYGLATTFWGFVAAECVGAVAMTFASGAFEAWFVDELRHHGYAGKLDRIFARVSLWKRGATILAGCLGAWAGSYDLAIPWFMGAAAAIAAAAIGLVFMRESYFERKPFSICGGMRAMKGTVAASVRYGIKEPAVRFVLMVIVVQVLAMQAINMQWQPFFKPIMPTQAWYGALWTGIMLAGAAGAWTAPRFLRAVGDERSALVWCQVAVAVAVVLCAAFAPTMGLSLAFFLVHEAGRSAMDPIKDAYLHDNIPSRERATILSFESLAHHLGGTIGLLASGWLAVRYGMQATWAASGLFLLVAALGIARIRRDDRKRDRSNAPSVAVEA